MAKQRYNSFGKNEMWYVMKTDNDAELIVDFDEKITKFDYSTHLENNIILSVMLHENVNTGDTLYIPTDRVHDIGAGVLIAKIKQTLDITYRIYDYNRVDTKTGSEQDLHNDLAADTIDYEVYDTYQTEYYEDINASNTLVHSLYFEANIIVLVGKLEKVYSNIDSFVIYICVEGSLDITYDSVNYSLKIGETLLVSC